MGLIPDRRRTGFPGGRLLVLLAAVAGLFAMHGMSEHGTMRHDATESLGSHDAGPFVPMVARPVAVLVDSATTAMRGMTAAATIEGPSRMASGAVAAGATVPGDSHAEMGLCLAILAGAALLALRRAESSSYPLASVLSTQTRQQALPSRARDPDPPDLHALSIQRC